MDMKLLSNPIVHHAIDALQRGDKKAWLSHFTTKPQLFDDGKSRDFHLFVDEAIGTERFTKIELVENQGLDVHGQFHSDRWGDFRTYFKFHMDASGKFDRLDIGQGD